MVLASRKATVAAAALIAIVVIAAGFLWLRDSPLVRVKQVDITGVGGSQAGEIREALTDAARDMTTLHVRQDALREAIQDYPVVRDLQAEGDFPHRLRITVNAYDPVGAMELGGRSVAVAPDGTVLDGTPTKGLALIAASGSAAGTKITGTDATRLVRLLAAAPAVLRSRAQRAYKGPNGLALDMRDGPRLDFGDLSRLDAKWLAAAAVLADEDSRGAAYVDLRLPERPVAGPLPATKEAAQGEPLTSP
jgi:cell division protein FtsQ